MSGELGDRDFAGALKIFDERGSIKWYATRSGAIRELARAYMADVEAAPDKRRVIIAHTNKEVEALNKFARQFARECGVLGEDHVLQTSKGERTFAAGDRIVLTANARTKAAREAGFVNSAFGHIVDIEAGGAGKPFVTIELDAEAGKAPRQFRFAWGQNRAAGEYDTLDHGWASTIWRSQGDTHNRVFDLHSPTGRANANYVALTRHSETVSVFVGRDGTRNFDELVAQMARGRDKTAASRFHYDERDVAWKEAGRDSTTGRDTTARLQAPPAPTSGREETWHSAESGWTHRGGMVYQQESAHDAVKARAAQRQDHPGAGPEQGRDQPHDRPRDPGTERVPTKEPREPAQQQAEPKIERPDMADSAQHKPERAPPLGPGQDKEVHQREAGSLSGGVYDLSARTQGVAASLREVFARSKTGEEYEAGLAAEGFKLARVSEQDAAESLQRREEASAAGKKRLPRELEAGELVIVNGQGTVYPLDVRITGARLSEIEERTNDIDRNALPDLRTAYSTAPHRTVRQAETEREDIEPSRLHDSPVREGSAELGSRDHAPPEAIREAEASPSPAAIIEQLAEAVDARAAAKTARAERSVGFEPAHAHVIDHAIERETIRMDTVRRDQQQQAAVEQGQTRGDTAAEERKVLRGQAGPGGSRSSEYDRYAGLAARFEQELAGDRWQDAGREISAGGKAGGRGGGGGSSR